MIHLGLLFFLGGAAGAVWRSRSKKAVSTSTPLPVVSNFNSSEEESLIYSSQFDDVGELRHYQKISWYAMAFTSSGWLFYPPVTMLAAPLLGYNTYNYLRSLKQSHSQQRKSALTVFELLGVGTTLLTGKPVATSAVMLFAFGRRNLLLQAGNISNNMEPAQALNYRNNTYWVLRDEAEVEVLGSELQDTDIVVFNSGDVISLEGVVVRGQGQVRQFDLKKKMKIVSKSLGDRVYPFTQLQDGLLHIKQ